MVHPLWRFVGVGACMIWHAALVVRGGCRTRSSKQPIVSTRVNERLHWERCCVVRRFQEYISVAVAFVCCVLSLMAFLDPTGGDHSGLPAAVFYCSPIVIYGSWLLLTQGGEDLTHKWLSPWAATMSVLLVVLQQVHDTVIHASPLHMLLAVVNPFAFGSRAVVIVSVVLSCSVGLQTWRQSENGVYMVVLTLVLGTLPIILSRALSHVLSLSIMRAIRLSSSVGAGEALFALLFARYDAIVELDEDARIVHASDTFFGIVAAQLPSRRKETSRQFLKIVPETSDSTLEEEEEGNGRVRGQSFTAMMTSDEDREQLMSAFTEQKMVGVVSWDGDDGEGCSSINPHREPATAIHVTIKTLAGTEAKVRLYCTACYDVEARRWRFFLGVCNAEAPADAPEAPDANLFVDSKDVLSREYLKVEATAPILTLVEATVLKGVFLDRGTPLSDLFPPPIMTNLAPFVRCMLGDARPGENRFFASLRPNGKGKNKVQDQINVEIVHDSREKEDPGSVQLLITITTRPSVRPGPGSSYSVGGSGSVISLASISEDGDEELEESGLTSSAMSELVSTLMAATGAADALGMDAVTDVEAGTVPAGCGVLPGAPGVPALASSMSL